jgi:hypothetical protein
MTDPHSASVRWYARPAIILPITAALIVLSALVTPQPDAGRGGDSRLTTYSTSPMGGRMFYDLAQRLGWSVEQRRTADWPADSNAIIAELDPVVPLRSTDVHELLQRVRGGGALLVMLGPGSHLLADSLHLRSAPSVFRSKDPNGDRDAEGCAADAKGVFNRRILYTLWPGDQVTLTQISWRGPKPDSVVPLVETVRRQIFERSGRSAAIGFVYGRGRIVASMDPDVLRNDAIRVCKYGLDVGAVRMLDFLSERGGSPPGKNRLISFDEYHQGFGEQRGTMSAIGGYLVRVASGRVLFQLLAAGLLLLLAAAPRLIPPHDPERIERRSPLEHVDALGRAYAQVGATRSATSRLLRGVRRRLAGGSIRPGVDASDDAFLERAQRDAPKLADEITLIKKALHSPVSRREFASVGAAIEQLEISLTRI